VPSSNFIVHSANDHSEMVGNYGEGAVVWACWESLGFTLSDRNGPPTTQPDKLTVPSEETFAKGLSHSWLLRAYVTTNRKSKIRN